MFASKAIRILLLGFVLIFGMGILYLVFAPEKLSRTGEEKLLEHVSELSSNQTTYKIVSVEKAQAPSVDAAAQFDQQTFTGEAGTVSGCPQLDSGEEAWCVALDREIVGSNGIPYSHFLVKNAGWHWEVLSLSEDDAGVFDHFDCGNW